MPGLMARQLLRSGGGGGGLKKLRPSHSTHSMDPCLILFNTHIQALFDCASDGYD